MLLGAIIEIVLLNMLLRFYCVFDSRYKNKRLIIIICVTRTWKGCRLSITSTIMCFLCARMYVRACVPNKHSRDSMWQCVLMCKLPPLVWEPNLWSLPLHTKCVPIATVWLTQWAQWVDCYNRSSVFHGESANMWSHRGTKEKTIHQITEYSLRNV